jgi:hypothetical protein
VNFVRGIHGAWGRAMRLRVLDLTGSEQAETKEGVRHGGERFLRTSISRKFSGGP